MKINPMPALIAAAEEKITNWFIPNSMDIIHSQKRQMAEAVLAGNEPTSEFESAANIEGMTTTQLANLIIGKPNTMMQKENIRREIIFKVRACKSLQDIETLLTANGVPTFNYRQ